MLKIIFKKGEIYALAQKSVKQLHATNHYFERKKKAVLLLIPDEISIKEELSKNEYKSKFLWQSKI